VWQAIVPAGGLSGRRPTDHSQQFIGFSGIVQRSPINSSRVEEAAWKGRLQARLPATRRAILYGRCVES